MLTLVKTPQIKHAIIDVIEDFSATCFREAAEQLGNNNLREVINGSRSFNSFANILRANQWAPKSVTVVTDNPESIGKALMANESLSVIGLAHCNEQAAKKDRAASLLEAGARIVITTPNDISNSFNLLNKGYSDQAVMCFTGNIWHQLPQQKTSLK